MSDTDIEMSEKTDDVDSDAASTTSGGSDDSSESDFNFLQRLRRRPIMLICVYCGIIGYGIFGIVFDWLWVSDMLGVEKGLVFGPSDDALVTTLIVIASVGTVSFFFEIADFTKKVYTGEPLFDEDISQVCNNLDTPSNHNNVIHHWVDANFSDVIFRYMYARTCWHFHESVRF